MSYIYVLVPIIFSLIIFSLTVGYFLLVKYRTKTMLNKIRQRMILEHCKSDYKSKPPDVTHGRPKFTGIYQKPMIPMVHQSYNPIHEASIVSGNYGPDPLEPEELNSDSVIEVPLRSYVHNYSTLSSGLDRRSHFDNNQHSDSLNGYDTDGIDQVGTLSQYRFADEFGPATAYGVHNSGGYYHANIRPY